MAKVNINKKAPQKSSHTIVSLIGLVKHVLLIETDFFVFARGLSHWGAAASTLRAA